MTKRLWKLSAILLIILALSACDETLDPFPAQYVYSIQAWKWKCSRHRIVSKDPVTVDGGEMIPWDDCPNVFGFDEKDTGAVFNWIRNAQKKAKERCQ